MISPVRLHLSHLAICPKLFCARECACECVSECASKFMSESASECASKYMNESASESVSECASGSASKCPSVCVSKSASECVSNRASNWWHGEKKSNDHSVRLVQTLRLTTPLLEKAKYFAETDVTPSSPDSNIRALFQHNKLLLGFFLHFRCFTKLVCFATLKALLEH